MRAVSRNKQAVTTAVASDLKSCALMLRLEDFSLQFPFERLTRKKCPGDPVEPETRLNKIS